MFKKYLQAKRNKIDGNTVLAIVSILALIFSGVASFYAIRYTIKVNSTEYQISENVKFELLKVVTELKSLDSKVMISPYIEGEVGFSQEMEAISNLRTSPGYMLILHSLQDDEDRHTMDANMVLLTYALQSRNYHTTRTCIYNILDVLKNKSNMELDKEIDIAKLVTEFCDMKILASEYKPEMTEKEMLFYFFLEHLIQNEKNTDPDVRLYYAAYQHDMDEVYNATQAGANPKVTDLDIIERYSELYDRFVIDIKIKEFSLFVKYLIEEKGNTDQDVLLFYGKHWNDTVAERKARVSGANPNVTNVEIMERYQKEYKEFRQNLYGE